MSDTTLDLLHKRLEDLRIDSVMIRGRIEELVHTIETLERRRGGRPRKSAEIAIVQREATDTPNGPSGVAGGTFEIPPDGEAA